ncbi:uncharacterized protein LOC142499455 isoform X2 [Ascaphus truei]|uniref:uncharacterized protein LOC142499455 isoform X2 n=1 Tax=Ascaphus truei TaxID=8439 RepID=UPI003F597480
MVGAVGARSQVTSSVCVWRDMRGCCTKDVQKTVLRDALMEEHVSLTVTILSTCVLRVSQVLSVSVREAPVLKAAVRFHTQSVGPLLAPGSSVSRWGESVSFAENSVQMLLPFPSKRRPSADPQQPPHPEPNAPCGGQPKM